MEIERMIMLQRVFLISDLHFNYRSMLFFGKRPFNNLKELHEAIIEKWNKDVENKDIVIIVGDFGKGSLEFFKRILKKLKGLKIFVRGNHDYWFRLRRLVKIGIGVYDEISLRIKGIDILISHKPNKEYEDLFDINIHGHHHRRLLPRGLPQRPYYNLAVEHNEYKPKLLTDIIQDKGYCIKNISMDLTLETRKLLPAPQRLLLPI